MFSSVCRYTVYHLNVTNMFLVLYLTTKKKLIMRATFVFALKLWDYQDNGDNSYLSLVVHKQLTLDDGNFYWTNYCDRQLFLIQTCILNFILISILFLKHCIRRIVHVMFRHLPKTILSNLLNICIIKHVMFHYNIKGFLWRFVIVTIKVASIGLKYNPHFICDDRYLQNITRVRGRFFKISYIFLY